MTNTLRTAATFALTFAIVLLLAVVPANAQTSTQPATVKVPFSFQVGHTTLDAGEYQLVRTGSRTLQFRLTDGAAVATAVVNSAVGNRSRNEGALQFVQAGGRYVLTTVWSAGQNEGLELAGATDAVRNAERSVILAQKQR